MLENIKGRPFFSVFETKPTEPPQYNPHGYGQKPLIAVIKQLQKNGLLVLQKGRPWFSTNEQGEDEDRRLSQFKASDQLIKICEDLGYTAEATQSNSEGFVELRTVKSKKRITYTETPYSTYTNELMSEYCEFLNQTGLRWMVKAWVYTSSGSLLFGMKGELSLVEGLAALYAIQYVNERELR